MLWNVLVSEMVVPGDSTICSRLLQSLWDEGVVYVESFARPVKRYARMWAFNALNSFCHDKWCLANIQF